MKNYVYIICVLLLTAFSFSTGQASILEFGEEKIVFSQSKIQKGVTWSDNFSLKSGVLETENLPSNQSQDVWIQTHAFSIGLSWRPPSSANFFVSIDGSINESSSTSPQIFIRYSPDKANWSTWYSFSKTDEKTVEGLDIYKVSIHLPSSAVEKYNKLMRDWWKTSPVWSSDETEFCEWLIKKEPDFFVKEKPFIGYVQVRIEKMSVNPFQNLKSISVKYVWGVGGLSSIPKDKSKVRKNTEDKWFFTTDQNK